MHKLTRLSILFVATQPTQVSQFQPNTNKPTTRLRAPAPSHHLGFLSKWVGSTSTPAPSTTLAPIGCAGSVGKDILFLVDGTVNPQQTYDMVDKAFKKIKRFIRGVIRDLNDASFRVGVMQFADKGMAHMEIDFMNPMERKEIKLRLNMIIQQRGHERYTGDALVEVNKEVSARIYRSQWVTFRVESLKRSRSFKHLFWHASLDN